jgi:hypothetical protein
MIRTSAITLAASAALRRPYATRRAAGTIMGSAVGTACVLAAHTVAAAASAGVLVSSSTALAVQARHASMYELAGKREQEGFLVQYDPLQVLGLPTDEDNFENVRKAYAELQEAHKGDRTRLDKIHRAYTILSDPASPYYVKSRMQDVNRRKMQIQLLPPQQQKLVKFQAFLYTVFVAFGIMTIGYAFLYPVKKMLRAATR